MIWTCPSLFVLFVRSEKLQNESFPNFSNFRPESCPEFRSEFSPNFSRTFRASFRGRRRPEKIYQKSPPFFNAKFPGKHEKNIHKILLESRQSNFLGLSRFSGNFLIFSGIFPMCPSLLSRPTAPTRNSPESVRDKNLDLSQNNSGNPPV